jgi:nitrile hydratase
MENTPTTHNVIVCTLCSCYPVFLIGKSPDWYKSRNYRSRVVRDPRAVLAEFGTAIEAARDVRVHDSTADMRYMVLPLRPEGTDGWGEQALADIITRDSLIGVTEVSKPA